MEAAVHSKQAERRREAEKCRGNKEGEAEGAAAAAAAW